MPTCHRVVIKAPSLFAFIDGNGLTVYFNSLFVEDGLAN